MARRQSQSAPAVSLFPFLAVLVCAMGALILLLLIITQKISHSSDIETVEKTEFNPPAVVEPVPEPIWHTTLQERSVSMASSITPTDIPVPNIPGDIISQTSDLSAPSFDSDRDGNVAQQQILEKQQQELEQQQALLESLEQDLQKHKQQIEEAAARTLHEKEKLDQLAKREENLEKQMVQLTTQLDQSQKMVEQLKAEIDQKKHKLETLEAEEQEKTEKLEIVTYDGRSGLERKPIFLECRRGEIVFHPEEVVVSVEDLKPYPYTNSPLAAAVAALGVYRRTIDPSATAPYVLLVVRPDGVEEYYGASQIMGSSRIDFGYELIDSQRELYFGPADKTAEKVIRDALKLSMQRRPHDPPGFGPPLANKGNGTGSMRKGPGGTMEEGSWKKNTSPRSSETTGTSRFPSTKGQFPPTEQVTANPGKQQGLAATGTNSPTSDQTNQAWDRESGFREQASAEQPRTRSYSRPSQQEAGNPSPNEAQPYGATSEMANRSGQATPQQLRPDAAGGSAGQSSAGSSGGESFEISIERAIKVQLTIASLKMGSQKEVALNFEMEAADFEQLFLSALSKEIQGWDSPPAGMRWKPKLKLEAAPGCQLWEYRVETLADQLQLNRESRLIMAQPKQSESTLFR